MCKLFYKKEVSPESKLNFYFSSSSALLVSMPFTPWQRSALVMICCKTGTYDYLTYSSSLLTLQYFLSIFYFGTNITWYLHSIIPRTARQSLFKSHQQSWRFTLILVLRTCPGWSDSICSKIQFKYNTCCCT